MSDEPPPRTAEVRPARVWQPTDLMSSAARDAQGFVPLGWASSATKNFWAQEIPDESPVVSPADQAKPASGAADGSLALEASESTGGTKALGYEPVISPSKALTNEMVERVRAEAFAQGVEETRMNLRADMAAEVEALRAQDTAMVASLRDALAALKRSPEPFFEPLKRLALHLAEQLVLAELALDAKAIDRLVQRCVDALASSNESVILVELNPADLTALEAQRARVPSNTGPVLKLQPNEALMPGSVRVSANDAVVDDLIEHRLAALARDLSVDVPRWQANSAFDAERLVSERASGLRGVEDARPRMVQAEPSLDSTLIDDLLQESEDDV